MARSSVVVRPAAESDWAAVEPLWADFVATFEPGPTPGGTGAVEHARARWEASTDSSRSVLVAWDGDQPVGLAALSEIEVGPWQGRGLLVSLMHVKADARRRGTGRALLAEAVALAERIGADHVVVDVPPHLRDAQRFFARLGFGPVITRRVASTAALHRRLHGAEPAAGRLARLRARGARRRARSEDAEGAPVAGPPAAGPVTT